MLSPQAAPLARIAFVSVLVMFLEMLLIRWVGTELRVFAYLQNGVLVAAFLGLGLGARNSRRPARLLPSMLALTFLAVVIRDPWGWQLGEGVTQGLAAFQDSVVWYQTLGADWPQYVRTALIAFSLLMSLVLLAAVAFTFRPLGQWLGAWMDAYPRPIAAYTANILGSLFGITLFVGATALLMPPITWLAAAGVGLAICAVWAQDGRAARATAVGLAMALPLFAWGDSLPTLWSPYQKLSLLPLMQPTERGVEQCGELLQVNNIGYMSLLDLDREAVVERPLLYPPNEIRTSHYFLPHAIVGPRERVLVVGSGAGNDVAAALEAGARHVDAVEIDPAIVSFGRARHPNRPYSSDRVTVSIDDARAYFRKATGPYDLIWFGLLDSHTNPSAYSNVRLDHFVYTRESFEDMSRLLSPTGVVVLYFAPEADWISGRMVRLMTDTFGATPLAATIQSSTVCMGWGGLLLVGGPPEVLSAIRARTEADPELRARLIDPAAYPLDTRMTTDDWPYLYLPAPGVPRYHLLVGLACLALGLALRKALFRAGEPMNAPMLLLGMGFMLLEVVGVSRAALYFGTTWTVNAYIVGAIFAMILLANLVASRFPVSVTGWPAVGLVTSVIAVALVPTGGLAALPFAARVVVAGGFLALPVFFSGLIFVTAWAATERKDLAFGSNLLGSLIGGVASMLSMAIGFRALMLVTLVVYIAALLLLARERTPGPAAAAAPGSGE
jgi:SAM-dependent methyltransferase